MIALFVVVVVAADTLMFVVLLVLFFSKNGNPSSGVKKSTGETRRFLYLKLWVTFVTHS